MKVDDAGVVVELQDKGVPLFPELRLQDFIPNEHVALSLPPCRSPRSIPSLLSPTPDPPQGALSAVWLLPAIALCRLDNQRMVLVVEAGIRGQVIREKALDLAVRRAVLEDPVPRQDSTGVRIDNKHRPAPRVEEHAVGRFFADSRDLQETLSRRQQIPGKHPPQIAIELVAKHLEKSLEPSCLDPEIPRLPDQACKDFVVQAVQDPRGQNPFLLEPPDGFLNIGPVRVLRQDCPDGNLKWRLPRPPVKIPEEPVQRLINQKQTLFRLPRFVFRKSTLSCTVLQRPAPPTLFSSPRNRCPCLAV